MTTQPSSRSALHWGALLLAAWCFGYLCGPPGAALAEDAKKAIGDLFVVGKVEVADSSKSVKTTLEGNGDAQFGGDVKVGGKLLLGKGGLDVEKQLDTQSQSIKGLKTDSDNALKVSSSYVRLYGPGVKLGTDEDLIQKDGGESVQLKADGSMVSIPKLNEACGSKVILAIWHKPVKNGDQLAKIGNYFNVGMGAPGGGIGAGGTSIPDKLQTQIQVFVIHR